MHPDWCLNFSKQIVSKSISKKLPVRASARTVAPTSAEPCPKQWGLYFFFPEQQLADTRDSQAWGWSPARSGRVGTQTRMT